MRLLGKVFICLFVAVAVVAGCKKEETVEVTLSLDRPMMTLKKGAEQKLKCTVLPKGTKVTVEWESSDEGVATVDQDGNVLAVAPGEADVIARAGEAFAQCHVTVEAVEIEDIVLDDIDAAHTKVMTAGETYQVTFVLTPSDADPEDLVWNSTKPDVATVEAGLITALKEGTTIISVRGGKAQQVFELRVTAAPVPVEAVVISEKTRTLEVGDSFTLTAEVTPKDADDQELVWESSAETVARVEGGKVTALSEGEAEITVTCGGKSDKCVVTVVKAAVPVESVIVEMETASMTPGTELSLKASVYPENADEQAIVWESSAEDVATVDQSGLVKALKEGEAVITASCGGKKAECTVSVKALVIPVTEVKLNVVQLNMVPDQTAELVSTVIPENATDRNVTWKSDKELVATVLDGKVTAVAEGEAVITAKCGGKKAECKVIVKAPVVEVSSVTVTPETATVKAGEKVTLTAVVEPSGAAEVTWSTKDAGIAVVENGVVTGIKAGTVQIEAVAGGKSDICTVTVQENKVAVESISVTDETGNDLTSLEIVRKRTAQLRAVVYPTNATDQSVTWLVNEGGDVVSVSDDGLVTALKVGKATLAVMSVADQSIYDVVTVTVLGTSPTGVSLDKATLEMASNDAPVALKATVLPADADNNELRWTSSAPSVATVDENGLVTPKARGTADITVTTVDGGYADVCKVTVTAAKVESINITSESGGMVVQVGMKLNLKATFNPQGAEPDGAVMWESDNTACVQVNSDGVVTGIAYSTSADYPTEVGVKCSVKSGDKVITNTVPIKVLTRMPTGVSIPSLGDGNKISLKVGSGYSLDASILPEEVSEDEFRLQYMSSTGPGAKNGVNYDTGDIYTGEPGEFSVDVRILSGTIGNISNFYGGIYAEPRRTIYVSVEPYWVSSLSIPESVALEAGSSTILKLTMTSDSDDASVQPYDKTVEWVSSDTKVATVDENGKVTAVGSGTADITVRTAGEWSVPSGEAHKQAVCKVTVTATSNVIAVGDFYYSDGSTSSTLNPSKTVIGVVLSRDNATSTDTALPSGCSHGLVLALYEGEGNYSSDYSAGRVNTWALANGYHNTTGTYYQWDYIRTEYAKMLLGYNNTMALKGYIKAYGYTSGILNALSAYEIALPSSASALYIPSIAEMDLMTANIDKINASLGTAGGNVLANKDYVTVSENEMASGNVAKVNPVTGALHGGAMKSSSYPVRFIFAF